MRRRLRRSPRIDLPSERLIDGETALRPWRDTDQQALVEACQDPEIARWTRVPAHYGPTDAKAYLLQRYDTLVAGVAAPFAIVRAPDSELLGSVSLLRIAWEHRRAEVGYWLAREARGHGHATRAVALICAWGFASLGIERMDLMAAVENAPSQRVADRTGFIAEAVLRSYARGHDGQLDMVCYGRLATDGHHADT
jgi:RimJ/RimL family protein N-acetyltransferase